MNKKLIPSGSIYYNLDVHLSFNDFFITIISILHEPNCITFTGQSEEYFHLIFYKDGHINFSYEDNTYRINPETFALIRPNNKHNETTGKENLVKYHIVFSINKKKKITKEKYLNTYQQESEFIYRSLNQIDKFKFTQNTSKYTTILFEQIIYELENTKFGYNYKLNYLFSEIFINFCRDLNSNTFRYVAPINSPSINMLSYKISSELGLQLETITLKSLAEEINLSQRQVQRHIKKIHNTTFKKKLNELRIEKAKILLLESDLPVAQISKEVGYKSSSYFDKVFRELENMSPNEYRQNTK